MAESEEKKEKAVAPEKPAEESKGGEKLKKISGMTLAEVEAALKIAKEKMGGFQSQFARTLLARKKELTRS